MSNNSENTNLQQNGETYLSKTEYGKKKNTKQVDNIKKTINHKKERLDVS